MAPTLGRLVLYRSKITGDYVVPAIVTCTQESWVPGRYIDQADLRQDFPMDRFLLGSVVSPYVTAPFADSQEMAALPVAVDGRIWQASPVAMPEEGRVHLHVFTPGAKGSYQEFNVAEGEGPGEWSWPPRVGGGS